MAKILNSLETARATARLDAPVPTSIHIPSYGYYSNVSRGNRKKQNQDEWIPCILESDESSKERRKNWARLIQKIYEVDPLTCPKCSGKMKVISVIEDQDVIKKILQRRTSPQAPGIMGGETPSPTPKRQIAAFVNRAPYRLFGHAGLPFRWNSVLSIVPL